ncbi:hypothetical protein [Ferruginibacter sp.]
MEATLTTREEFMDFFRDDEKLNLLTADDRIEIFSQILLGNSDFTKKLLEEVLGDYGVSNLVIFEIK